MNDFIAECLSHTCTHMLQRCTQEQHSMRKWSRRKRRTEVKAEGDGLCRVPGREVWHPFLILILAERGSWRVRRQGGGRMCFLQVWHFSLYTSAFWVDWWRLRPRWMHWNIIQPLYMVAKRFYFLYLLLKWWQVLQIVEVPCLGYCSGHKVSTTRDT